MNLTYKKAGSEFWYSKFSLSQTVYKNINGKVLAIIHVFVQLLEEQFKSFRVSSEISRAFETNSKFSCRCQINSRFEKLF